MTSAEAFRARPFASAPIWRRISHAVFLRRRCHGARGTELGFPSVIGRLRHRRGACPPRCRNVGSAGEAGLLYLAGVPRSPRTSNGAEGCRYRLPHRRGLPHVPYRLCARRNRKPACRTSTAGDPVLLPGDRPAVLRPGRRRHGFPARRCASALPERSGRRQRSPRASAMSPLPQRPDEDSLLALL